MGTLTIWHQGRSVSTIEIGDGELFRVEYRPGPDHTPQVLVCSDEVATQSAVLTLACESCGEEVDQDGTHHTWSATPCSGTGTWVELQCPYCRGADIVEVNVAELRSTVEDLRWDPTQQCLLLEIQSPVYGDWEGDGWACADCGRRVNLPVTWDAEYV